jgi:hypothetical protein
MKYAFFTGIRHFAPTRPPSSLAIKIVRNAAYRHFA